MIVVLTPFSYSIFTLHEGYKGLPFSLSTIKSLVFLLFIFINKGGRSDRGCELSPGQERFRNSLLPDGEDVSLVVRRSLIQVVNLPSHPTTLSRVRASVRSLVPSAGTFRKRVVDVRYTKTERTGVSRGSPKFRFVLSLCSDGRKHVS